MWCALLDAWGIPADRLPAEAAVPPDVTTVVVPALLGRATISSPRTTTLLVGEGAEPSAADESVVRAPTSSRDLRLRRAEEVVDAAQRALESAAPLGLVGIWRWPRGAAAAVVVDGDVDHPRGVDPECSRYVAPALETAARAGFDAYGIYVAGANVDAEPEAFAPTAPGYYNHSYGHPYSHWDPRPWEALDAAEMADEIRRCADVLRRRLGRGDEGMFRLPHFQLDAADRTYRVLDELGYVADSSIGANVSVTGGLPFHPAVRPWSDAPEDAPYARSHPERAGRRSLLQLPISTDPTDAEFLHGCCSYNTLGEGVRARTADPEDYEGVLDDVLAGAVRRNGLAHLFIDPPDAGYGRLAGDAVDYAAAVERWMRRMGDREDLAVLTTAELSRWWLRREAAVARTRARVGAGRLIVDVEDPPPETVIAVLAPERAGGGWTLVPASGVAA